MKKFSFRSHRAALTLLELVVVLVILATLAALIIPRLSGIASQSSSATNASLVADTNRAVEMFATRYSKHPLGWDSLLSSTDAYYTKLNPKLTAASPALLQIATLDAGQAKSLQDAGIVGFHDADEARTNVTPSDNSSVFRFLASGKKVVTLVKTPITDGHGDTFIDNAFNINQYKSNWNNEFVVMGLGGPTSLKGATMSEIPLVQSAEPNKYYARVLCVYMIPAAGATSTFPAQYVGSFLPDATSLRNNVDKFNQADTPVN